MRVWTAVFPLAALAFLFFGDFLLRTGNVVGASLFHLENPTPMPVEKFWLTLTVSLMITLTALCYYIQKDVVTNKRLTSFVLISKAVSTVLFLIFFARTREFNYLMGAVFSDGPIFAVTLIFYRRGLKMGL